MKRVFLGLLFLILLSSLVFAHQPRLVFDNNLSVPYVISNPEVSQAFYGILKENPDYYLIDSEKDFNLYLNILSPAIQDNRKDFSVEVYNLNETVARLDGTNFSWELFYEEFAGDDYWRGPEFEKVVSKGEYLIKVYNSANVGKYSLAVGKIESFPFNEAMNAILSMPKLKSFFEKPFYAIWEGKIMQWLTIALVVLVAIVWSIIWFVRRLIKNRKKRKSA